MDAGSSRALDRSGGSLCRPAPQRCDELCQGAVVAGLGVRVAKVDPRAVAEKQGKLGIVQQHRDEAAARVVERPGGASRGTPR